MIIQSYNTFEGHRMRGGFATPRSLQNFLKESYKIHSQFDYCLYTDKYGYEIVKKIINKKHIKVIEFEEIDDRIPYISKFQVQQLQKKPYIHVDLDAILYNLPISDHDIICEKLRTPMKFGKEISRLNLNININKIICSGIIGFNDIDFKNEYIKKVYEKLDEIYDEQNIGYAECYALEEILLTQLAKDNNKTIFEINQTDFIHRHGNVNKKIS